MAHSVDLAFNFFFLFFFSFLSICRKTGGCCVHTGNGQSEAATDWRLSNQPRPHGQMQRWDWNILQRVGAWWEYAALSHEVGTWSQAAETHSRWVQSTGDCKHLTCLSPLFFCLCLFDPASSWSTQRPPDHRKETQTAVVWSCLLFIRSGQNHLARHSEREKKTRQTEEEVERQHQRMDWLGVRQVPEGSGEQEKNWENWLQNHLWCPSDPGG